MLKTYLPESDGALDDMSPIAIERGQVDES